MMEDSAGTATDGTVTFAETVSVEDSPRLRPARVVLQNLFGFSQPTSVIDVGCGDGAWLQAAREEGAETVFGVCDGTVRPGLPEGAFLEAGLSQPGFAAFVAEARGSVPFDLAIALGVAEVLPFERSAGFVEELCGLSDVVLFAAAPPLQDNHPNGQWPEFWGLHFRRCGFRCFDLLRLEFWANPDVEWRLSQNLLVFVREASPAFSRFPFEAMDGPLSLIHPALWVSGRPGGGDAGLAALSYAWMAGDSGLPSQHAPEDLVSRGRALVLFTDKTAPVENGPAVARLQEELAAAKARARLARLDLDIAEEGLATLRLDKSDAERTALEEFHLRMNMERDFLLADAAQKRLAAANEALREQVEGAEGERTRLPQIMVSLNRALERERATASQTAGLRDRLDEATATIERLTEEREAMEARVAAFFAGSWRLVSPARALRRILGEREAG